MTPLFRKFLGLNWLLLANMLLLIAWGVWSIYNASAFRPEESLSNKWRDQVQWCFIGMVPFFAAALMDYRWIRWGAPFAYLAGVAGLVAVKLFANEVKGAKSIIDLGVISVQPSQFAIAATIFSVAVALGCLHRTLPVFRHHWLRLGLTGILVAVPMVLVLTEPDLGSAAVYGPVLVAMLLVGSIPFRYLITLFLVAMCVIPLAYFFKLKPYQKQRIEVFINLVTNKKIDKQNEGYMADKVQIAVGSAGFEGKGPLSEKALAEGQTTVHRAFYTATEAFNDFIYSVIVEEFGFRGGMLLILGLEFLLLQCIFIAFYARDQLGRLLVVGVAAMIFAHSMQHIGMNVLMMPITGLPLPFTSYGGTFLVVTMGLMGMVQSVWIHRNISPVKIKNGKPVTESEEEYE